ncbi:MAG: hypothetical protein IPK59_23330 [Rhodospirillaceae bacterium]|nr:hypothetical protein [Rhodospirillaceae bacterium]
MDQSPNASATILDYSPTFNNGVPSDTTAGMLSRVGTVIGQNPQAIFLLGGVNDYPLGLTRAQTRDNIVAICNACLAAGIAVYVEAILPVGPGYPNYGGAGVMNAEAAERNAMVQSALPVGATWIDWGGTLTSGDWTGDQIHLSASGYVKMNAALASYVDLYR